MENNINRKIRKIMKMINNHNNGKTKRKNMDYK